MQKSKVFNITKCHFYRHFSKKWWLQVLFGTSFRKMEKLRKIKSQLLNLHQVK